MSGRDLLRDPVWRGDELGLPLPADRHAVSVALPRWQDVVGYEEKSPAVLERLQTGYPRFVLHERVLGQARALGNGSPCLPFPSERVAARAEAFVRAQGSPAQTVRRRGAVGVVTDDTGFLALKAFWQHTGLIVSSRQAEAWLEGASPDPAAEEVRAALRERLAGFYECAPGDVFLAPTGMAAQWAGLQAVQARRPGRPTLQLGFPYVDTLKLQQKFGPGAILLHELARAEASLRAALAAQTFAACFGEIPGNPLLGSPDVRTVTPLLRQHGTPFVADDVVATPFNVDLSGHADLIATSLTKYVVGTCDAMGGALICHPRSPYYRELKAIVQAQHEDLLWPADARVLERQARSFPERMARHNAHGLFIAERLRQHPAVERVWFPKWECSEAYEAVRRPTGGWGSLVTFLPRRAEQTSARLYDRLRISKGPSLGTVFTLACPFTLLAHYDELSWAESCGVSRYLIRVSVGLEDPEELWNRFDQALNESSAESSKPERRTGA